MPEGACIWSRKKNSSGSSRATKPKLCHDGLVNSVAPIETQTGLAFRFFGEPEFRVDQLELHIPIRKLMALMAYLAVEGAGSRSKLAGLLWSELDETSARRNLRQRLYRLNPPELTACLQIETDRVTLGTVSSDVQDFSKAMQRNDFSTAVILYKGVFLDGLEVEDASAFHDWLDLKRDDFARQYQHALAELATQLESDGHFLEALQQHLLLIAINPLLELHQRQIMRLHLHLRQPAEGLAVFERFRDLLALELGLEPTPETLLLATQMRQQEILEPVIFEKKVLSKVTRVVLSDLPMIGRSAIWQALENAWQAGQMVFISGEPGMGKSRLLKEFAATRPTISTLGRISDSSVPFATQTRAIRGLLEANPQLSPPAWIRQELSRLIPALHDAPPSDRPESRLRLFDAFTELLWMTTQAIDTHLIDDLQFFDSDSFEMLLHSFSRFAERPNSKRQILAFRHGELSPAMQQNVDQMIQSGTATLLPLEPLGNLDLQHLVTHLFGANHDFSDKLHRATGGNPFFALETLKTLVESDALQQNSVGTWDATSTDLPMPQSVMVAVRERVARLGSEATRLLETASLAGDTFALEDIQNATTLTEFQALEAFEKALVLQLLEQQENGYRFTHDLVRESIALGLGAERRRLLHQKLAVNLEQRGGAATRIAGHLERAGQTTQAIPWRIKAAEEARRVYAHREALHELEFAMQNGATGREAYAIQISREALFRALGDSEARAEIIELLSKMTRELSDSSLETEVALLQLTFYNDRFQAAEAFQIAEKLLKMLNLNTVQFGQVQIGGATALLRLDRVLEAETWFGNALKQKNPPPTLLAAAYSGLRICAIFRGEYVLAQEHINRSLENARLANDQSGEIEAIIGVGRVEIMLGEYQNALIHLESGIQKAQAIGDKTQEFFALCSLTWLYAQSGQFRLCIEVYERATSINVGIGNIGFTLALESYYGLALQHAGALSQSLTVANMALAKAEMVDSSERLVLALQRQAQLHLALGDIVSSAKQFSLCLQEVYDDQMSSFQTGLETGLARCAIDQQDLEQASKHLQSAVSARQLAMKSNQRDLELTQATLQFKLGNSEFALETTAILDETVQYRAQALTLRLEVLSSLQAPMLRELEAAQAWLETPEIPALERLELQQVVMQTLTSLGRSQEATVVQTQLKQEILQLSSTLKAYPELQKCFLEKFYPR
jgi:DNA-binding SARP family transcriptional activator/tetratricopeptide (TPR) repeat protein